MSALRSPLPWLAGILAIYLITPFGIFVANLSGATSPGPELGAALVTSVVTATISTAIVAILGIPLAYLLARTRGRLASVLWMLIALPIAIPALMSGILLLYLVGPYAPLGQLFGGALTNSLAGIVLAQTFVAAPFLVIAAQAAFRAVDPSLEEVARTLGHRATARFLRVRAPRRLDRRQGRSAARLAARFRRLRRHRDPGLPPVLAAGVHLGRSSPAPAFPARFRPSVWRWLPPWWCSA